MRIIHLTDLHFIKDKYGYELNKIQEIIKSRISDDYSALLFFTGDLVFKGDNIEDFNAAHTTFIQPLIDKLNLNPNNYFITAGNHDVHRSQEMPVITKQLLNCSSKDSLDTFLSVDNQRLASFANLENFLNYKNKVYENYPDDDIISDFIDYHKRKIDNNTVEIVSINSSWRSHDSEVDSGNLLFPVEKLKAICTNFENDSFKILILHHPLQDFKYWNKVELEDIIYREFHLLLHGHVHLSKKTSILNDNEGIVKLCSDASLTKVNKYEKLGFSILDIDLDIYSIKCKTFRINDDFNVTDTINEIKIPVEGDKAKVLKLNNKIKKRLNTELKKANELLVLSNNEKPFLEVFSDPILKNQSQAVNDLKNNSRTEVIPLQSVIENYRTNFIIFGKDKSGKTAILYYTYIKLLKNSISKKLLPLYIDCNMVKPKDEIDNFFTRSFELTKNAFNELKKNYTLILLIDNLHNSKIDFITKLNRYLIEDNVFMIASHDENILSEVDADYFDEISFERIFIHEIKTFQIKRITNKTLECNEHEKEEIINKIKTIFRQLNMPFNYWTVSLFLYLYIQNNQNTFHNNFELVQLYIDNLLDRENIVLISEFKISYEDFKVFLGEFSYFLVKEKYDNNHTVEYTEFVNFIKDYKNKNKRFVVETNYLINLLLDKEILKYVKEDTLTFRLNGIFEYFIAYYMKDNMNFTNEVIENDNFYLSFGNELELVAGFKSRNKDFLERIFNKTKNIFKSKNEYYNEIGNTDENLTNRILDEDVHLSHQLINGNIHNEFENKEMELDDELFPVATRNQEVVQKKFYPEIIENTENLEKSLFILSRVYRNSSISDDAVLDFILDSACNLCFFIIDEQKVEKMSKSFSKLFKNFMPIVIQNFLFDALAQNNLEKMFLEKIEILKNSKSSELKIFILYYLLIDLDFNKNKKYIKEAIGYLKMNSLKHASLYKLLSYLLFKKLSANSQENLISLIFQQQKLIDNSEEGRKNIQKQVAHLKKVNRLKE